MKIKRMASSFQEIAKSSDAEFLTSTEPPLQSGLSAEDRFESNTVSKDSKLFLDNEIDSAQGSRDIFQIVESTATFELGQEQKYRKASRRRRASFKMEEPD